MIEARSNPKMTRRSILAGAAMGLTAAAAAALQPRAESGLATRRELGPLIPAQIGEWQLVGSNGVIVARADETVDGPADGYEQVVARTYQAATLPSIMLLLAYGSAQGGGLQLHRPETCYPGQGFSLSRHDDVELLFPGVAAVDARRFTATRDERVERLIYWTRIGGRFPRDTAGEYAAILRSALSGSVTDGLLVRISTLGNDVASSDVALDAFAQSLIAALGSAGRRMLIGAPASNV